MGMLKLVTIITLVILAFAVATSSARNSYAPLKLGYYYRNGACRNAESIIKEVVTKFVKKDPTLAASLLRMHFHDCFVRGCDASVLLNSTKTNKAERDGPPNLSLRGWEVIDAAKAAVEAACPSQVSCADVLALAARDSVEFKYGPTWDVPTGRRDGIVSIANETLTNLPPPFANFSVLQSIFAAKGLNVDDLVALSGGHSIGVAHCSSFSSRLYGKTPDPSLDPAYASQLRKVCKPGDLTTTVPMDATVRELDSSYFQFVKQGKGLLQSDAALLNNRRSKLLVNRNLYEPLFLPQFAKSMTKMGLIGVLTGRDGQIRKTCSKIN